MKALVRGLATVLSFSGWRALPAATVLLCTLAGTAQAGTIVRVSTSYGDFSVELLDETAPATVQNFLNYVNRGAYNGTFIHRLERHFVLQGGGYRFQSFVGPIAVPADAPVVNEFNVSNTRGTLAMAKLPDQPDSATNQWFINLGNNSANLDATNGGFTVFGNVLGEGMTVVDAINNSPIFNFGGFASTLPLRTDNSNGIRSVADVKAINFITLNMVVTQRHSAALHVFEYGTGRLILTVDAGAEGIYSLNLSLVPDASQVIFQLNHDSMVPVINRPDQSAVFTISDNRLRIPVLEVNEFGNVRVIRNVVLVRSDETLNRFTLESYEE